MFVQACQYFLSQIIANNRIILAYIAITFHNYYYTEHNVHVHTRTKQKLYMNHIEYACIYAQMPV